MQHALLPIALSQSGLSWITGQIDWEVPINADRYRHTGRTYVNISGALIFLCHHDPGAHAPG